MVDRSIITADGRKLKAIGMGDLDIELPNGLKTMNMMFKDAVHAADMAFTLISISRLDKSGYQVVFNKGMCKIMNPKGQVIATIPHADRLYRVTATKPSASGNYAATANEHQQSS